MSDQTVNVPLLRKAVEWAEVEAEKPPYLRGWYQGEYAVPAVDVGRSPTCGTCYCIAGYVALMETGLDCGANSHDVAEAALGLTSEQSGDLFAGGNDIDDVRRIADAIAGERL